MESRARFARAAAPAIVGVALSLALTSWGWAVTAATTPPDAAPPVPATGRESPARQGGRPVDASAPYPEGATVPWGTEIDWDGDGAPDKLRFDYTGGAHCCYRIRLEFGGASHDVVKLPFDLDGGYVGGSIGSDPRRLRIQQGASLPELVAEIATYAGKRETIPAAWRRTYGVRSHFIAISFPHRTPRIRNLPDRPSAAR